MNITPLHDGYCINDQICIFVTTLVDHKIYLAKHQGSVMTYDQNTAFVVNYPGEYDKDGIDITCFSEVDGLLDYLIITGEDKIAIIQTTKALEFDGFTSVTEWIVPDDELADQLAKLEMDGRVTVLSQLNF